MAQLVVRNHDEALVAKLKLRAAEHGRSTEAEHREILREALSQEPRRRSFRELAARVRRRLPGASKRRQKSCFARARRAVTLAPGERVVIDANVAVKWVVTEPGSELADPLLDCALVAPDLLFAECANILWKKVRRSELTKEEAAVAAQTLAGAHRVTRFGR